MSDPTCENRVGTALVDYLQHLPDVAILSYHPTSAKAYQSEIIRIPKLTPDGRRTRDRYHVDLIFISGNELWLTELKCRLSESDHDVEKLHDIMSSYVLVDLIGLIASRLTSESPMILKNVKRVVPALGVEIVDDELPTGFVVLQAKDDTVAVYENEVASLLKKR